MTNTNAVALTNNPFSSQEVAAAEAGAVNAVQRQEQERAIAETKAAIMLAKQFPRDQAAATDRILMACCRPTLAEKAVYIYPKGGQEITGASIRLAEAIAQAWGNMQFGIRELDQREGVSTVEAFAWDVENNTRQTKVFQVAHKRHTKKGDYMITDPREIYEMVANQGARRMRNCILGLIPGDVIEAAINQAEKTIENEAAATPEKMKVKVAELISRFEAMGVSKEALKKKIGRNVDETMPVAIYLNLVKIGTSIKDGYSTAAENFEIEAEAGAKSDGEQPDPDKGQKLFDELEAGLTTCEDVAAVEAYLQENLPSIAALAKHGKAWATQWANAVAKQRGKVGA